MAESEIAPEAPAWMLALEKKRQRVHRLAHEVGAGSLCLLCKDDCPGLDLHFWRKICRNCKCRKEDHDVVDDCGMEQFEILLGSGHSAIRPKKSFLDLLEKHTSAGLKSRTASTAFDWIPPNVSPVIAAEYMQSLPLSKLPISGSDGALYRRQQLERQLPLHDLDASHCHQLTDSEVENLNKYLENLKNNVVGQGRVAKLSIPSSKSLDSMQKMCTFNSVPKPFQTCNESCTQADSQPPFGNENSVAPGQPWHLKPPSAFWPKSVSPDSTRSASPEVSCISDPTSSPASVLSKSPSQSIENETIYSVQSDGRLVKGHIEKSIAQSVNVPGKMWVPEECLECSKKAVDGQLVTGRVCVHVVKSDDISQGMHSSEVFPAECGMYSKRVNGELLREKMYDHKVSRDGSPVERLGEEKTSPLNPSLKKTSLEANYPVDRISPTAMHGNRYWHKPDESRQLLNYDNKNFDSSPVFSSGKKQQTHPPSNQPTSNMLRNEGLPEGSPSTGKSRPAKGLEHFTQRSTPGNGVDPKDTISPYIASIVIDDGNEPVIVLDKHQDPKEDSPSTLDVELHCAECKEEILPAEVVVFADRAGSEVVWHPGCFVCCTCQELLVDLVYFFNKGRVYCGRHYAELLDIPRCNACDELIFVNEYTVAEEQTFHVKHFCCFECDEPLAGNQYVAKDGQPVCLPCYEKKYGKQCATCRLVIGLKDQGVSWKDQCWHATPDCFCCFSCKTSLLGGRFAVKDQRPFCSNKCMQVRP